MLCPLSSCPFHEHLAGEDPHLAMVDYRWPEAGVYWTNSGNSTAGPAETPSITQADLLNIEYIFRI